MIFEPLDEDLTDKPPFTRYVGIGRSHANSILWLFYVGQEIDPTQILQKAITLYIAVRRQRYTMPLASQSQFFGSTCYYFQPPETESSRVSLTKPELACLQQVLTQLPDAEFLWDKKFR